MFIRYDRSVGREQDMRVLPQNPRVTRQKVNP